MIEQNHLSVATCNVRGLKNKKKRKALFQWFQEQSLDIIFLQETHCHLRKEEYKWGREWKGMTYWSRGTSRSRGVAVLFNKNVQYEVKRILIDPNGRYITFDLNVCGKIYRFINIYAPNSEYE